MLNLTGTRELATPRLVLRRFTAEDAPAMFAGWASDSRVTRYLYWEPHEGVEETRRILRAWLNTYADETFYQWAIVFEGRLVGSIGTVALNRQNRYCEVGYCLSYDEWGKGIVTEALKAVLAFLFEEVGMNRVFAKHDADNPASGRVMEKCGMTLEGTLREQSVRRDGSFGDLRLYAILRREYEGARAD